MIRPETPWHRIEWLRFGYRCSQIAGQYGIEEVDEQIAVFHRAEQCLEYAIYLGVYAVFHGGLL